MTDAGELAVWKNEALESRQEKARLRAKIAHIEASGPTHDLMACSEFVREMTDEMLRCRQELKDMTKDRDAWFDAYNELRDQGSPSWDMFDATVGVTVSAIEDELRARQEAMARVRDMCAKPSPDLIATVFAAVDAIDMEDGWHAVALAAAQPVLVAIAQALEMPEVRYT